MYKVYNNIPITIYIHTHTYMFIHMCVYSSMEVARWAQGGTPLLRTPCVSLGLHRSPHFPLIGYPVHSSGFLHPPHRRVLFAAGYSLFCA